MQQNPRGYFLWGSLLLALVLANIVVHWPKKSHAKDDGFPGIPPGAAHSAAGQAQFEAAVEKLPEDQRAVVTHRMEQDRAFFDAVKNLPETERVQKTQEYLAKNPLPQIPGMPAPPASPPDGSDGESGGSSGGAGQGGPGGAGNGGPGDGGPQGGHIPEPGVRHSMDQNIANSQTSAKP